MRQKREAKTVNITETRYDENLNVVKTIDAEGRETEYRYDPIDRLTAVILPGNKRTDYEYDNMGRVITMVDPNRNKTRYKYKIDLEENSRSIEPPLITKTLP